jgi:drug/metabolite transporter (DMT)-like permease
MLKDYIHLHFIIFLWGFTALVGKWLTLPAVELVLFRTFFAVLGLWVLLKFQKTPLQLPKRAIYIMLATGCLTSLHWITFFASAKMTTVSICLVGLASTSLWTSFVEPLLMKRRIRPYEIGLGLLIIGALYWIMRTQFHYATGLLVAVLSAVFVSFFSVINGKLAPKYHHNLITFYEMVGALGSLLLFLPFYTWYIADNQTLTLLNFTATLDNAYNWVGVAFLAFVCTVYAYAACVEIMKRVSAFAVNLSVNMEPVYGILLAAVFLREDQAMTSDFYLGAVVILLAVLAYPLLKKYLQ